MSSDWNRRARSDARYYVALGSGNQTWEEFFAGGEDLVAGLARELPRLRARERALEIGCGPGRLMLPLSRHFSEIQGVDVSVEMVNLARKNLSAVSHAHVQAISGTDLSPFGDDFFDFVYSYAVFQHIPDRAVVRNYLTETRRVLKVGGVARLQFNGLARTIDKYDTWSGVRFSAAEIREFAMRHDLQLVALEGLDTQYMWATLVKQPAGWYIRSQQTSPAPAMIRKVTNASSAEPVVPTRGRFSAFALSVEGLPPEADLNSLGVRVANQSATLTCISPLSTTAPQQISAILPAGLESGLQPVQLVFAGKVLVSGSLRVVPPGPSVPAIVAVNDALRVGDGKKISSQMITVSFEELPREAKIRAMVAGRPSQEVARRCVVPFIPRHEVDFRLPAGISGRTRLECWIGNRRLGSTDIVVQNDRFYWLSRLRPTDVYQAVRRMLWRREERRVTKTSI